MKPDQYVLTVVSQKFIQKN